MSDLFGSIGDWIGKNWSTIGSTILGGAVPGMSTLATGLATQGATDAAKTQSDAAQAGIDEQKRQFDEIQKLLSPYVQSGTNSINAQNDLLGLNGEQAQQQALSALQSGSQFQALNKVGSDAILSNAAATGGLRGGNVQGALAGNSQNILNSLIQQRFSNLGSLSSLGQNAAAGVGSAGQNSANQISSLLQQQGAAQAGGQLAQGSQLSNTLSGIFDSLGSVASLGKLF